MVVGSMTPETWHADHAKRAQRILSKVEMRAKKAGISCSTRFCTASCPYEAIISTAKKNRCDLIVMASHGRRGIGSLVLGSETNKVLTHSKLPVLVFR